MSVDALLLPAGVSRRLVHTPNLGVSGSSGSGGRFDPFASFDVRTPSPGCPANQVSSLCSDGLHRPLFDFDWPDVDRGLFGASILLGVPRSELVAVSSTSNWHVYAPTVAFTWPDMVAVLGEAVGLGVTNDGWRRLCVRDGGCYLRLPGVVKQRVVAVG